MLPGCGVTFAPGLARISPLITTWSSAASPLLMTRKPSLSAPISTTLGTMVPSRPTVMTSLRD